MSDECRKNYVDVTTSYLHSLSSAIHKPKNHIAKYVHNRECSSTSTPTTTILKVIFRSKHMHSAKGSSLSGSTRLTAEQFVVLFHT